jgi:hypothetical protein
MRSIVTPEREEYSAPLVNRRRLVPRRARVIRAVALAVVLLLGAAMLFVGTQRGRATEVSLDEAISRFHEPRESGQLEAAPAESAGVTEVAPGVPSAGDLSEDALVPPRQEHRTETGVVPAAPFSEPEEGVYTYRAEGEESLSLLGARHTYPDQVFATVRHLDGCGWELRVDVIKEHVDELELCGQPGALFLTEQSRTVEFFGKRDGFAMRCRPPQLLHAIGEEPGTSSVVSCSGGGATAKITRTFIGSEMVTVGGESVESFAVLQEATLTGDAEGESTDRLWLHPSTGLVLRWERSVDTLANAAFGAKVRYREEASFELQSLTPRR